MKILLYLIILSVSIPQDYYEVKIVPEFEGWGTMMGTKLSSNDFQFVANTRASDGSLVVQFYIMGYDGWFTQNTVSLQNSGGLMNHQLNEDLYILAGQGSANSSPPYNTIPGKLKIYENNNGTWSYNYTIHNPDPDNYQQFGQVFYRNDNLMIVTALHRDEDIVKLHIYRLISENWVEEFTFELVHEYLGEQNLYIDENMFMYGNYNADLTAVDSDDGSVLIFKKINESWENDTLLTSNPLQPEARFGKSIIYDNETLFIGAYHENDETGAVYIFKKINGIWTQTQRIQASDSSPITRFGKNFTVKDNCLLINAPLNQDAGPGSGSIYLFNQNEENLWVESRKICSSDLAMMDLFGGSIGFVNDYIVASAPMKNNMSGAIYIYNLADTMLHSNFATYPVTGNAPLTLNFNDLSQGEPTAWQWDFDSDGIVDSEQQYPEHTYEFSGDYTVTLTVTNNEESSTFTKENYISVTGGLSYGDLNDDSIVNIIDILIMVDVIMGEIIPTATQIEAGDMNNSGIIDIIDIVLVVNQILEIN